MFDLPPALYEPPDAENAGSCCCGCAALRPPTADAAHRGLGPAAADPVDERECFSGRGVVFCQAIQEPDEMYCREYLMEDPILTEAMLGYLDLCRASDWVRSKKIYARLY